MPDNGPTKSCDQGRHDDCPHRLGGPQEGGVILKLSLAAGSFTWRCGCPCHNDPWRAGRLFQKPDTFSPRRGTIAALDPGAPAGAGHPPWRAGAIRDPSPSISRQRRSEGVAGFPIESLSPICRNRSAIPRSSCADSRWTAACFRYSSRRSPCSARSSYELATRS